MPYDPDFPAANTLATSAQMRAQLNGLKALIDAIPAGPQGVPGPPGNDGGTGPQGPPFASIAIDQVVTLPPGSAASVAATLVGDVVHLTIQLPRGDAGPAGEVTLAQLDDAIAAAIAGHPTNEEVNVIVGAALGDRPTLPQVNDAIAAAVADRATTAALAGAVAETARNPSAVAPLTDAFSDPPTLADLEAVRAKLNELIAATQRA